MVVSGRTCKGRNDRGEPCRAAPRRESDFCIFHDPENAEAMQEARRLGGMRRRRESTVAAAYDFESLGSVPDIRRLLDVAAYDALGLENSIARCRVLVAIGMGAAKLLEVGELEERMASLEAALGSRAVTPSRRR
jgi:hypothetical protein